MLLTLESGTGGAQRLWVTRRLWLGLYGSIASLTKVADESVPPEPRLPQPARTAAEEREDVAMVDTIRVVRLAHGVRIVFATASGNVRLDFQDDGVARFRRLLEAQAERAGWDSAAALRRLKAGALAGDALRRAKA
jgi:hypothetical protein